MDGLALAHQRIQDLYAQEAFRAADRHDQSAVNYWLGRMDRADQITAVNRQIKEIMT